MNLFLASLLFSVIILIYWIILELFTVMFRITGLPDDKARFQVLSLLTGAGFTTRESESILSLNLHRLIISFLELSFLWQLQPWSSC